LDCLLGDPTLFTRADEVEAAWRVVTPVLSAWEAQPGGNGSSVAPLYTYEAGTWGPKAAEDLLAQSGRRWRRL
jgi:glucose-6-phosphate 1-dehydrogenase